MDAWSERSRSPGASPDHRPVCCGYILVDGQIPLDPVNPSAFERCGEDYHTSCPPSMMSLEGGHEEYLGRLRPRGVRAPAEPEAAGRVVQSGREAAGSEPATPGKLRRSLEGPAREDPSRNSGRAAAPARTRQTTVRTALATRTLNSLRSQHLILDRRAPRSPRSRREGGTSRFRVRSTYDSCPRVGRVSRWSVPHGWPVLDQGTAANRGTRRGPV